MKQELITLNKENFQKYGCRCFCDAKQPGHLAKLDRVNEELNKWLKIKQLYLEWNKAARWYIEYIPGENARRWVTINDYMFIHCLWINPKKYRNLGYGKILINEAIEDAKKLWLKWVATVSSNWWFMHKNDIFIKNWFKIVDTAPPWFELLVLDFDGSPIGKFNNTQISWYKWLNIVFSMQCPWVNRSLDELEKVAKNYNVQIQYHKLSTPKEVQNWPSIYWTFALIYDNQLIVDHYISATRFNNILSKELKL